MSSIQPITSSGTPIENIQTHMDTTLHALGLPRVNRFIASLVEDLPPEATIILPSPHIAIGSRSIISPLCPSKMYGGICIGVGGINGILMTGAIHEFFTRGQLKNLSYYAGSSVGSIIVTLLAVGYEPIDMLTALCAPDFTRQFLSLNFMNLPSIYGLYPNSTIRTKLEQMIMLRLGYIPTFAELYHNLGKQLIIPIYCLSEPETNNRKIFCSRHTTPDMSILDAIILSCSIPIMFQKANYKGKVYIDGSYTSTFPIQALQDIIPEECDILGICLENNQVKLDCFLGYITAILMVPLQDQDNLCQVNRGQTDVLEICSNANAVSSITFDLTATQKMNMFSHGTKQVRTFLASMTSVIELKEKKE